MMILKSLTFFRKYFVVFLFFTLVLSFGQNKVLEEIDRLDMLCKKNTRNPDSLLVYAQQLLDYSEKHNYEIGSMKGYSFLGFAQSRLRNYEKSNILYYQALTIAKRNDIKFEHKIYNNLSNNHRATKYMDSALFYNRKLLKFYEQGTDARLLNLTYMNLGNNFFLKSDLDSSEFYLRKAIAGFEKTLEYRLLASTLGMLGETYYQKTEFEKALKYTDSSQLISEDQNLKSFFARNYNLLSRIHEKLGQSKEAERYMNLALENRPRNIENVKRVDGNQNYENAAFRFNRSTLDTIVEDKKFYKSTAFRVLFVSLCLLVLSLYLFRRNRKTQQEVNLLQKELNNLKNGEEDELNELIYLKSKVVLDSSKIEFVKSDGHYLEFYVVGKNKPEIDRNSMINIMSILPEKQFVRIHKSYIVNIKFVKIINSTKIMLDNGKWINLSRTYKQHLKEILQMT